MSSGYRSSRARVSKNTRSFSSNHGGNGSGCCGGSCSLSFIIVYGMAALMLVYVMAMVSLTHYTTQTSLPPLRGDPTSLEAFRNSGSESMNHPPKRNSDPNYQPKVYTAEELQQTTKEEPAAEGAKKPRRKGGKEWGEGVEPQLLRKVTNDALLSQENKKVEPHRMLKAYLEPMDPDFLVTKPLPVRKYGDDSHLTTVDFPQMAQCSKLMEQFPVDDYPDADPYLPWIHDVFPTHDGKFIQFVAQNKERCHTGTTESEKALIVHTQPQVSLFQHVAVKRVEDGGYRLADHPEADEDGMETRFICRFSNGEETLSVYNFNYEYASYRKRSKKMFHEEGTDNKLIHTSQLTFQCPVPASLQDSVRTGETVVDDVATLHVDVIPIRTPTRYGAPTEFLPPYYEEMRTYGGFNATTEWGPNHVLPKIEHSGRWENIPICKPSLLTYGKTAATETSAAMATTKKDDAKPVEEHRLVSCLWASTGYATRGNRFAINDGQRRLLEWITYNKLIGVEHFYLYDNSGAFSTDSSLQPIADMFPDDVTVVKWPAQVCNNNPNNVDSCGERSSQYAAEASCRLRFGPHTEWILQTDIDEYLVPMGEHESIYPLLDKLDDEGMKIVSFGSWRAWPRRRFIETPVKLSGVEACGRKQDCFQLHIPMNYTMLQAYNCDRQLPGQKGKVMPAEKQIYKPSYVKHHFIHYSTVTENSVLNRQDTIAAGKKWYVNPFPDPYSRFGNEEEEGLMLHTKAVATQDTILWEKACKAGADDKMTCRLGSPFPENMDGVDVSKGDEGWKFNCYVNHKIDDFWVKRLEENLKPHIPELASRGPITWE